MKILCSQEIQANPTKIYSSKSLAETKKKINNISTPIIAAPEDEVL